MIIRIFFLAALLVGCTSISPDHGHVPDEDSARVFARFQLLQPPFDSATAVRVLGDSWMRKVKFYNLGAFAGFIPLHSVADKMGAVITVADFSAGRGTDAGYSIYLHVRSRATARIQEENLRYNNPYPAEWKAPFSNSYPVEFFGGHTSSDIQVEEYTLCYPDGHLLNVQQGTRKIIPADKRELF